MKLIHERMNKNKGKCKRRASAPGVMSTAMAKVYEENRHEESRLDLDLAELGRKHHLSNIRHYTEVKSIAKELVNLEIEKDNLSFTFTKKQLEGKDVPLLARKKIAIQRQNFKRRYSGNILSRKTEGNSDATDLKQSLVGSESNDRPTVTLLPDAQQTKGAVGVGGGRGGLPPIDNGTVGPGQRRPGSLVSQRRHSAFPRMISTPRKEITADQDLDRRTILSDHPETGTGSINATIPGVTTEASNEEMVTKTTYVGDDGDGENHHGANGSLHSSHSPKRMREIKEEIALHDKLLQNKINDFLLLQLPGEKQSE